MGCLPGTDRTYFLFELNGSLGLADETGATGFGLVPEKTNRSLRSDPLRNLR